MVQPEYGADVAGQRTQALATTMCWPRYTVLFQLRTTLAAIGLRCFPMAAADAIRCFLVTMMASAREGGLPKSGGRR